MLDLLAQALQDAFAFEKLLKPELHWSDQMATRGVQTAD
jgi:hypothetical protein